MLVKNIKDITINQAIILASKGIYFIVKDGKIKGFTK